MDCESKVISCESYDVICDSLNKSMHGICAILAETGMLHAALIAAMLPCYGADPEACHFVSSLSRCREAWVIGHEL